ncbi:MAG: CPBP family intramembrane metalloprotease [Puniceicoccales bacterium]|jgi:membrane protease YdiL (CAAX protease family)|nr:CPBP family intramembrane metalloprotease [Puniceicoccales bacterium]
MARCIGTFVWKWNEKIFPDCRFFPRSGAVRSSTIPLCITGPQLLLGFFLLMRGRRRPQPGPDPSWPIARKKFFLFFGACFTALLVLPIVLDAMLPIGQLSFFLPALSLGCCLSIAWRWPGLHFSSGLSPRSLPWRTVLANSLTSYLRLTPILFLAAVGWSLALQGLCRLGMPLVLESQEFVLALQKNSSPWFCCAALAAATVLAPAVEELFFRGGIHRFLRSACGASLSNWTTALAFALLHANLAAFLPLLLLSLTLGHVYEREGSIWPPMVIHGLFNLHNMALILMVGTS